MNKPPLLICFTAYLYNHFYNFTPLMIFVNRKVKKSNIRPWINKKPASMKLTGISVLLKR